MTDKNTQLLVEKGEMLPLMEAFYTIQGEGFYKGAAAYFIRLGGCDVGCHWCDVKESWDANLHPPTSIDNIVEEAVKYSKTIVVTGGEPLMWNMNLLQEIGIGFVFLLKKLSSLLLLFMKKLTN